MLYNNISDKYESLAKNQTQAAQHLLSIIPDRNYNHALDIGCGTGKLTAALSSVAKNTIGIDFSVGMIDQAIQQYDGYANFLVKSVYDLSEKNQYDLVVCNSSLHWFKDIDVALNNIFHSLVPSGILAIQTPVKFWSELLCDAITQTMQNERVIFYANHYSNPWFHLQNVDEYNKYISKFPNRLLVKEDVTVVSKQMSIKDVMGMFYSGPAQAYLSEDNYSIALPVYFEELFITIFRRVLENIWGERKLMDVSYNRCFLIVEKL